MLEFNSMEDILDFAIQMEIAAQKFYQQTAVRAQRPAVAEYFTGLIEEEKTHEQQLRDLKDSGWSIPSEKIQEIDVSGYVDAMQVPPDLSYKEAVKLAYDKEKSARMLYAILADLADQPELKQIFTMLTRQEDAHADYFKQQYDNICLSEN